MKNYDFPVITEIDKPKDTLVLKYQSTTLGIYNPHHTNNFIIRNSDQSRLCFEVSYSKLKKLFEGID